MKIKNISNRKIVIDEWINFKGNINNFGNRKVFLELVPGAIGYIEDELVDSIDSIQNLMNEGIIAIVNTAGKATISNSTGTVTVTPDADKGYSVDAKIRLRLDKYADTANLIRLIVSNRTLNNFTIKAEKYNETNATWEPVDCTTENLSVIYNIL